MMATVSYHSEVEFTIMRFDSFDAVMSFAGEHYEVANVPDAGLLSRHSSIISPVTIRFGSSRADHVTRLRLRSRSAEAWPEPVP
jgi:hypothetical protein